VVGREGEGEEEACVSKYSAAMQNKAPKLLEYERK